VRDRDRNLSKGIFSWKCGLEEKTLTDRIIRFWVSDTLGRPLLI